MSRRSTIKIIAALLEQEPDELSAKDLMGDTDVPFYWIKPGVRVLAPHPMDGPKPATIEQVYRSQINPSKGTAKARWDHDQYLGTVFFNKLLTPLNKTAVAEDELDDEGIFKDVAGPVIYRTFNLEFDFGAGEPGYSTVIDVPAHLLPPVEDYDNDPEETNKLVRKYAHKQMTDARWDPGDRLAVGWIPADDWMWLVTVEETDPQQSVAEAEEEDVLKDVTVNPDRLGEYGYFVYFSDPVNFKTPWGTQAFTKIGPYSNTHEASRKKRFGLMDTVGVTAWIKREMITDERWGAMFEPPVRVA